MGILDRLQRRAADIRRAEEALYAMALEEVTRNDVKPGLWAKAFAEAGGDEAKAHAGYLKLRVQQMRDELAAMDRVLGRLEAEYGEAAFDSVVSQTPSEANSPAASPPPVVSASEPPSSASSDAAAWKVGGALVAAAALAIIAAQVNSPASHTSSTYSPPASFTRAPPESPTSTTLQDLAEPRSFAAEVPAPAAFVTSLTFDLFPEDAVAVQTVAGQLAILNLRDSIGVQQLTLNGESVDLSNDFLTFVAISRHGNQDIILMASQCGGSACGSLDLAFIRLFSNGAPTIETSDAFRYPTDEHEALRAGVTSWTGQIRVALGLSRGALVTAGIGPDRPLEIARDWAPIEPLAADDCSGVVETLKFCATFEKPCTDASFREFPHNCSDAPMTLYRQVSYLANHTTGFDLPAFAHACSRASQLGMAPSDEFVRQEICSGADPAQWSDASESDNAAAWNDSPTAMPETASTAMTSPP